jgi:hypothetical protein
MFGIGSFKHNLTKVVVNGKCAILMKGFDSYFVFGGILCIKKIR